MRSRNQRETGIQKKRAACHPGHMEWWTTHSESERERAGRFRRTSRMEIGGILYRFLVCLKNRHKSWFDFETGIRRRTFQVRRGQPQNKKNWRKKCNTKDFHKADRLLELKRRDKVGTTRGRGLVETVCATPAEVEQIFGRLRKETEKMKNGKQKIPKRSEIQEPDRSKSIRRLVGWAEAHHKRPRNDVLIGRPERV